MSESFHFEICRKLGQGAASEVWLATHLASNRDVAIKVFKTEDEHAQDVEQLLRETRLVARSAHPNILQVYGYGRCPRTVHFNGDQVLYEGQLYLVSEYVLLAYLEKSFFVL